MKMKSTIFNLWQTASRRLLFCTLAFWILRTPVLAQSEDEEEEEVETAIKQPTRKAVQASYPTVTLKGVVTDQATESPWLAYSCRPWAIVRYTAMTEEDGTFTIKVPEFATALYVHAPELCHRSRWPSMPVTPPSIAIEMLSDKFQPMYGTEPTIRPRLRHRSPISA